MSSSINCNPLLTQLEWCLTTLATAVGENNAVILIDPIIWSNFKTFNETNLVDSPATDTVLNFETTSIYTPQFTYDQPVVTAPETIAQALFPNGPFTTGMYFFGSARMFDIQNGRAQDGSGVPYGTASMSIPFSAQPYSPDVIAYIQSRRWNALRLSSSTNQMFIYGGQSGMECNVDDPVMLQFAGTNDNAGQGLLNLTQPKTGYALEIINLGTLSTTPQDPTTLQTLYAAFQSMACMPQATNL